MRWATREPCSSKVQAARRSSWWRQNRADGSRLRHTISDGPSQLTRRQTMTCRRLVPTPALVLLLLLALGAARSMGPAFAADDTAAPPTFRKDVAPILQAKCQECHQPNSIAPMSLITFQESRPWAQAIKQRVASRQMPPWHIDPSVGVREFKNDLSLTQAQIDTIVQWVDAGAP